VVKKHSDAIWKRFIAACDYFFEEKKKQTSNIHTQEHQNLKTKKEIIASINAILNDEAAEEPATKVRELMQQWQEVGHVPYKEKDKIYAEYKEAIDKAFDKYDMKAVRARMANFENSLNQMAGTDKVYHERERMVRTYEQKCQELKTYENNLGFFNARSNTGNTIVKEMERKIAKIKEDIAMLEQKIKLIDEKI
jgi:stress response protein YsnF